MQSSVQGTFWYTGRHVLPKPTRTRTHRFQHELERGRLGESLPLKTLSQLVISNIVKFKKKNIYITDALKVILTT